jgi:hypothetical protein
MTDCMSATKHKQLILLREILLVYYEDYMKHIITKKSCGIFIV